MIGLLCFVLAILASPFKSKLRLEAENAVLRHQLIVLKRRLHGRVRLTNNDRWFFIQLYRWFPSILKVLTIIQPGTLVRWHRVGFRCYWRWKSRPRGGRSTARHAMFTGGLRVTVTQRALGALPLKLDPNSHAWLKACRAPLRVEAQAQRIAVVIANN